MSTTEPVLNVRLCEYPECTDGATKVIGRHELCEGHATSFKAFIINRRVKPAVAA